MDSNDTSLERLAHFAVVICTNHRAPGVKQAVDSVLVSRPTPGFVVIVEQAGELMSDFLRESEGRSEAVLIHDNGTGLSRARNIGTAAAEALGATVVAYTDDDCTVDPGWLAGFASAFAKTPDVALVFGSTKAAPHDADKGTIPAYLVPKVAIHRGVASKPHIEGMGACMAVRIDAWRSVGGFDDRLGAGTPLAAAEENDLSLRLLLSGFAVAETPAAEVMHHGFRDRLDASTLMAGYMRGSGAATAKMVRLGGFAAVLALATIGKRWLSGLAGVEMGHLPPRRTRLMNFLKGASTGFQMKIDCATGRFLPFNSPNDMLRVIPKTPQ